MKNFFKKIKINYYLVLAILMFPSLLNANPGSSGDQYMFKNPINANSFQELIKNLFDAIIQIGYVFVVMALLFAGFKFVMAQGNPEELSKAKKIFLYTVIGGVILLGSQVIAEVVCNTAAQFNTQIQC